MPWQLFHFSFFSSFFLLFSIFSPYPPISSWDQTLQSATEPTTNLPSLPELPRASPLSSIFLTPCFEARGWYYFWGTTLCTKMLNFITCCWKQLSYTKQHDDISLSGTSKAPRRLISTFLVKERWDWVYIYAEKGLCWVALPGSMPHSKGHSLLARCCGGREAHISHSWSPPCIVTFFLFTHVFPLCLSHPGYIQSAAQARPANAYPTQKTTSSWCLSWGLAISFTPEHFKADCKPGQKFIVS